jgi:hypothetical protein
VRYLSAVPVLVISIHLEGRLHVTWCTKLSTRHSFRTYTCVYPKVSGLSR